MATHVNAPREHAGRGAIDPDTALGPVRLYRQSTSTARASFYERAIGLRATELDDGTLGLGVAGEPRAGRAAGRQLRPAPEPARSGPLPPGDPPAHAARPGVRAGPPGRRLAGRSTAPPTTWSARRCICPIRTATGSRSTATVRATTGSASATSSRWRRCRSTSNDVARRAAEPHPSFRPSVPAGTTIGHVHLQVSDLGEAEALLPRRARLRRDGAGLSRGAVRVRRRLPPPHRAEHLAQRRRRAGGGGLGRAALVHDRAAERVRAGGACWRVSTRPASPQAARRRGARARPVRQRRRSDGVAVHPAVGTLDRSRRRGGVVTQRPAKPSTPVRFRSSPCFSLQTASFCVGSRLLHLIRRRKPSTPGRF